MTDGHDIVITKEQYNRAVAVKKSGNHNTIGLEERSDGKYYMYWFSAAAIKAFNDDLYSHPEFSEDSFFDSRSTDSSDKSDKFI